MPPSSGPHGRAVAAWANPSSRGSTTYETVLWASGELTCDCPGWVNKKRDQPRGCRHTKEIEPHVARLLSGALTPEAIGGVRAGSPPPPARQRQPTATNPLTGRLRRQFDL